MTADTDFARSGSLAAEIADWALNLHYDHLPAAAADSARWRFLDIVGICLAARKEPFALAVAKLVKEMDGQEQATAVGVQKRIPTANAALLNGTLAHGLDFDDTHNEAIVHASAVVVPTALAAGEATGASGREVLAAAVAGYEVISRLGAAAPGMFHARGFHATQVCGTFAAAVVAGKLIGLNADQMIAALGISGSQAGGIFEYLSDGSWTKRLHPGWAAHSGIMAALIAYNGFTGPATVFEGRYGLYQAFLAPATADLTRLTAGLGTEWETLQIGFKPFPCCHFIHGCLESARALRSQVPNPAAVAEVICTVPTEVLPIVCEPAAQKQHPETPYDGQFSIPFSVAAMLTDGYVDLRTYTPEKLVDPAILELSGRVTCAGRSFDTFPKHYPGQVTIRLHGGRVLTHATAVTLGTSLRPLGEGELRGKFGGNLAYGGVGAAEGAEIAELILKLENLTDLSPLMTRLQAD